MTDPDRPVSGRDDRRDLILDAAAALFAEEGDNAVSMRAIAARAGFTTGAIYPVFAGKDAIIAALFARSLDAAAEAVAIASTRAEPGLPAFEAGYRAMADYFRDRPGDLALALHLLGPGDGRSGASARIDPDLDARLLRSLAPCQTALEQAGVSDARALMRAAFAGLIGVLMLWHGRRLPLFDTDFEPVIAQQMALVVSAAIDDITG